MFGDDEREQKAEYVEVKLLENTYVNLNYK